MRVLLVVDLAFLLFGCLSDKLDKKPRFLHNLKKGESILVCTRSDF